MKFLVTGYGWIPSKGLDTLPEHVLQSCVVDVELSSDEQDVEIEASRQLTLMQAYNLYDGSLGW